MITCFNVSILVVVDWSVRRDYFFFVKTTHNGDLVSILVVVDWSVRRVTILLNRTIQKGSGFNPCCSGLVGETLNLMFVRLTIKVSILVVVDWSVRLALKTPGIPCTRSPCFNPCCSGLVGETPHPARRP